MENKALGISEHNKIVAKYLRGKFDADPEVFRYKNDDGSYFDLLSCRDSPIEGVTSYSTIGLSNHAIVLNEDGDVVNIEIIGACENHCTDFANALVSAATFTVTNNWQCVLGSVLRNVLDQYNISKTMTHFLFVEPYLWQNFDPLQIEDQVVNWLMAIPISDDEYECWNSYGFEYLVNKFVENQIDVFNINRNSIFK